MQSAVITGGAGGMGLATAKILGKDHRVVIADLNGEALESALAELRGLGIEAESQVCDVTDRDSVDALLDRAESGGHVRALAHTAGVSPSMGKPELIHRINAVGTVNIAESYLRLSREGDALVNVASIAGHMSPGFLLPKRTFKLARTDIAEFERKLVAGSARLPEKSRSGAAYGTSKAFVIWYSAKMAALFGARGTRVVSVSPGSFDTAMGRLEEDKGSGALLEYAALKRFGKPDEVAAVIAFAASEAPGYLTGTDILVDGGTKAGLTLKGLLAMQRQS